MFDYFNEIWDMCEKHMVEITTVKGKYDEYTGNFSINLSEIYTFLIKRAAECEVFSSDILYDFEEIKKAQVSKNFKDIIVFGFRDMGVDNAALVYEKLKRQDPELKDLYILFLDKIGEAAILYKVDLKMLYNCRDMTETRLMDLYEELDSLINNFPSVDDCTDKKNQVYNDMSVLRDSLFNYLYEEE